MSKRYLILSASTGAGHVRAGEALELWGKRLAPDAAIEHRDIASLLSRPMRELLINSYNKLTPHFPRIWGALYKKTNTSKSHDREILMAEVFRMAGEPLRRLVADVQPDHILATHFLPPLLLPPKTPVSTVITDFAVHRFWLSGNPRRYFVSTEEMKRDLITRGVRDAAVTVSGIPIHPNFTKESSTDELKGTHGIPPDKKVVLVLSGGYGLIRTDRIVETLLQSNEPLVIIAIAGKNTELKRRLELLRPPPHMTLLVVGWTDALHDYMRMADMIVGKPGGLTTTESIAMDKPFIAINPIPGHEDANVAFLEAHGYGVLAKDISALNAIIQKHPDMIAPGYKQKPSRSRDGGKLIWETLIEGEN